LVIRTTSAVSIAASVPLWSAAPTCASASAGASLIPSPKQQHTATLLLQRLNDAELVFGQQLGVELVDVEPRRHVAR
jgi:hypothetical protein